MSKIEELLENEKVEWKKLGDSYTCLSITTGLNPRKNFKLNDPSQGQLTSWYITTKDYSLNGKIEFVEGKTARITEEARQVINRRSKLEINDILFSAVGTVGKIAFVDFKPDNFDVNESTFVLKPNKENIVPKYLVYYLKSDYIQREVKKFLKGSTLSGLRKNNLEDLQIPIPSIEVQEKIVKTLDNFTNYVTELQAELQARTKQYEYYRDMILSEEYLDKISGRDSQNDGVIVKTSLKEIAEYSKRRVPASLLNAKNYVGVENLLKDKLGKVNSNYVPNEGNLIAFNIGDILIGNIRPYLRKIWIADLNGGTNGDVLAISLKEDAKHIVEPRFLYQILASESFFEYNVKFSKGAKMPRGDKKKILEYEFFLPSMLVQKQIVSILDHFDSIVNNISVGLPKEIELRQKQYEYYREKLLDFKK